MPRFLVVLTVHCLNLIKAESTLPEKVQKLYTREPTLHKPHHDYIHAIENCVILAIKPVTASVFSWLYGRVGLF